MHKEKKDFFTPCEQQGIAPHLKNPDLEAKLEIGIGKMTIIFPTSGFTDQSCMKIEIGSARCKIWPALGAIGGFFAEDRESALAVLAEAERQLREECGFDQIVGPMDGNTWQKYRFVTETDGSPPFLMEPENPPEWPEWWQEAGWKPLAEYISSRMDLPAAPGVPEKLVQRIESRGVSIRPVEVANYEAELRALYPFLLDAFSENFLYTSINEAEFLGLYLPAQPLLDPDFVRIAEDAGGRPVGLVFCVADGESLIVKTLASQVRGLGSVLLAEVHERARLRGLRTAIHALKHVDNTSVRVSERQGGEVFRRYTLFSK
ncbi:MAG: hypothetical protein HKN23_18005 [Verrucomicrobiales bacterium]|nr:hypothetical protein [Verrucomicrobiales bacterium]